MKSIRITAVLSILVLGCIAVLWTLGILGEDLAKDVSSKALGVVVIVMVSGALMAVAMKGSNPVESGKNSSPGGPKF